MNYASSEYLGVAAHMTDTMIAMYTGNSIMNTVYIGLADGTHLCVDEHSANKFDGDGNIINFPVRERPWYKGAAESGDVWFSDVYEDNYTGILCITCSAPVYAGSKLVGVAGADLFLDSMSDYINSSSGSGGFICVVNGAGHVIFAPDNNGLFTAATSDSADDVRYEYKDGQNILTIAKEIKQKIHQWHRSPPIKPRNDATVYSVLSADL